MLKKSTRNRREKSFGENEIWLLKELGVYDEDPEKDKKINDELMKFLQQQGLKKAKIIIKDQEISNKKSK